MTLLNEFKFKKKINDNKWWLWQRIQQIKLIQYIAKHNIQ